MIKNILIISATVLFIGCGFNSKQFNTDLSKNNFIGVETITSLKKMDPVLVEGLCQALTKSMLQDPKNHKLILNKEMVCAVNDAHIRKELKND